jgi:NADPH:quinone reductase
MNGLTALNALELAALKKGQILAVSGGAGLLAYYAIAAAKQRGLKVIADAKAADAELVRGYGANIVVERGPGFAEAIRRELPNGAAERGIEIKPMSVSDVLERTEWLELLRDLVAAAKIKLRVAGEYAPEQAADAQRALEAGGLRGRPVIRF